MAHIKNYVKLRIGKIVFNFQGLTFLYKSKNSSTQDKFHFAAAIAISDFISTLFIFFTHHEMRFDMLLRFFLTGIFLATLASSAAALERLFPPQAKRGTMSPATYPAIVINGAACNLSPGARIWNTNNMIDMPNSLSGSSYVVNYTENLQGDIDRIWLLTVDEASQPAPNKLP